MSKNRSNSGIRNSAYLKSHQFLQSNNQSSLQNFHSHVHNPGNNSSTNKNFAQGGKLSISQMKTMHNLEGGSDAMISVEKGSNYTSFHTNKQTSFRQSYHAGGNVPNGVYNHYSNMNNYSSLTNSSSKPGIIATTKENSAMNALKIAKKDIKGISRR